MISILHLSDLHIVKCAQQDNLKKRILAVAESLHDLEDGNKLLIITGDFHNYSERNYTNAEEFIKKVIEKMGIDIAQDVFVIPGNHDVSNDATMEEDFPGDPDWKLRRDDSLEKLKNTTAYDDATYNAHIRRRLESYSHYNKFVKKLGIYNDTDKPAAVHVRCWREKLNILHLNTTLIADGTTKDNQKLDINSAGDESTWQDVPNALPALALGHNNFFDLDQKQRSALIGIFFNHKVCAYLCGDTHKENTDPHEQWIHLTDDPEPLIPNIVCVKGAANDSDNFLILGSTNMNGMMKPVR